MKTWVLRIRAEDRIVFNQIKSGRKKVETRALGGRFDKVFRGDILLFLCGKSRLKKPVRKVLKFRSIKAMLKEINSQRIWPHLKHPSLKEIEEIYHTYPDYKERIQKHGLVAFWV